LQDGITWKPPFRRRLDPHISINFRQRRLKKCANGISNLNLAVAITSSPCYRKSVAFLPAYRCGDAFGVIGAFAVTKAMQAEAAIELLGTNLMRLEGADAPV
jgi:hypothetical protein